MDSVQFSTYVHIVVSNRMTRIRYHICQYVRTIKWKKTTEESNMGYLHGGAGPGNLTIFVTESSTSLL